MIRFSPYLRSGKVRDLYAVGDDRLLLVASDRLSAFDVVMPTLVPDKGRVLTGLSRFWFEKTAPIVPNHLLSTRLSDVPVQDWPWQARPVVLLGPHQDSTTHRRMGLPSCWSTAITPMSA